VKTRRQVAGGALLFLVFVGCLVALLAGRLLHDGRTALLLAEREAASARPRTAAISEAFERALRAYVPGASHVARAVAGLEALAARARAEGRTEDERIALSSLRSGLLGARWLTTPFEPHARAASERLATLTGAPGSHGWPPPAARRRSLTLAAAGLALMAGAAWFVLRRRSSFRRHRRGPVWASVLALTLGLVLFIVGLRLA